MLKGLLKIRTNELIKEAFQSTLLSCILLLVFSIAFVNISFFNPLNEALKDFDFLDVYYAENFSPDQSINKDIVIINIEQCTRFELALILEKLNTAQPKVIGFDVILKDQKDSEIDAQLVEQLNKRNIVTSFNYEKNEIIANHKSLRLQNPELGYINFNFDNTTSVIRDFKGISKIENKKQYLFSAKVAQLYLTDKKWNTWDYEEKLKTPQKIKFFGNYNQFLVFDYDELLAAQNLDLLKNKIVLMGYVGTPTGNQYDIEDKHFTPLNKVPSGKSIPDMYGVIIHANILSMLIENDFLISIPQFWIIVITFLTMFLSTLFFLKIKDAKPVRFINKKRNYLLLFSIISVGLMLWLFSKGIIFKVFPIIIATLFVSEYFEYYAHFVSYIKSKPSWKFSLFKKK